MPDGPSPLGRYATAPQATERQAVVRLLGVPVRLYAAGREHHDGVMREFRLLALSDHVPPDTAQRLVELTQLLGVRYAGATARPDTDVDAALERGDTAIDLTYVVPVSAAEGARELEALMAEADAFCRSEQLLTTPRPPALVAFVEWYLRQFTEQVAGGAPERWEGPLDVL